MNKLIDNLHIAHKGSQCSDHLTASVGVAATEENYFKTPLDLLEAADFALYQAKHKGRNSIHFEIAAAHEPS